MRKIIGLIGAPGAGKDSFAEYFVKFNNFNKLAFADEIKKGYYKRIDFTENRFKNLRGKDREEEIRKNLWKYSSEICKINGNDYFVNVVVNKILLKNLNFIITDIRTEIELKSIISLNGKIILILRNYIEELKNKILPGTKLRLSKIIEFPIFWNTYDSLDDLYINLRGNFMDSILGNSS